MAKSVKVQVSGQFTIDGIQDGSEDFDSSVSFEYAQRRRLDGKVKDTDGDSVVSLAGITPKMVMIKNVGGGSLSAKLSGHADQSVNILPGSFMVLATGSVTGISLSTGSTTNVFYDMLILGD